MGTLRIRFDVSDVGRIRLAGPDPMWEIACSMHRLQTNVGQGGYGSWHQRVRRDLGRTDVAAAVRDTLLPLLPRAPYFPDFLTPPPVSGIAEGIDVVQHTPPARVRRELELLDPGPAGRTAADDLAAGRPDAIRRLGVALSAYFRVAVGPYWEAIGAAVARDRAARAARVVDGGAGQMLHDLGPTVTWTAPELCISGYPADRELELGGRGITLVPSYFCWNDPVALADPELPPTLVYPLLRSGPADVVAPQRDLVALLGRTRLAVLQLTATGASTTELARRAGIAPATASEHARVLRNAGLVTSVRQANMVVHHLSDLGARLLAAGPDRGAARR